MKTIAVAGLVFRIGRLGVSLELAPWTLAPFNGRFDDPEQKYRVRYVALSRRGGLVECLSKYRPDLDALAAINAIDVDGPPLIPGLPIAWLTENEMATAAIDVPLDNGIVDLTTGEGIAQAHLAIEAARRRTGRVLRDYDASVLLSATPREFTQAISRYLYEAGFSGIAYRSRFAPEEVCIALFEGRHALHDTSVATITRDDADLTYALGLHHVSFAEPSLEVDVRKAHAAPAPEAATPGVPEATATPSFRAQIHDLVYRLRALVASVGPNPTDDEEGDVTLAFGSTGLAREVHEVKLRIRNFTGYQNADMMTLSKLLPVGTAKLLQVADLLERLASAVPAEALSTPVPVGESDD